MDSLEKLQRKKEAKGFGIGRRKVTQRNKLKALL